MARHSTVKLTFSDPCSFYSRLPLVLKSSAATRCGCGDVGVIRLLPVCSRPRKINLSMRAVSVWAEDVAAILRADRLGRFTLEDCADSSHKRNNSPGHGRSR